MNVQTVKQIEDQYNTNGGIIGNIYEIEDIGNYDRYIGSVKLKEGMCIVAVTNTKSPNSRFVLFSVWDNGDISNKSVFLANPLKLKLVDSNNPYISVGDLESFSSNMFKQLVGNIYIHNGKQIVVTKATGEGKEGQVLFFTSDDMTTPFFLNKGERVKYLCKIRRTDKDSAIIKVAVGSEIAYCSVTDQGYNYEEVKEKATVFSGEESIRIAKRAIEKLAEKAKIKISIDILYN